MKKKRKKPDACTDYRLRVIGTHDYMDADFDTTTMATSATWGTKKAAREQMRGIDPELAADLEIVPVRCREQTSKSKNAKRTR